MGHRESDVPEPVSAAIAELWRTSCDTEDQAIGSGAFRLLIQNCKIVYSQIESSRLPKKPFSGIKHKSNYLETALRNYFRWQGAPWHKGHCPSPDEAALNLHNAFLIQVVKGFYLAPLNNLGLEDPESEFDSTIKKINFGPNEIVQLSADELSQRINFDVLKRFKNWVRFPIDRVDGFYWLAIETREEAGLIWKRNFEGILDALWETHFSLIDQFPLFEPIFPAPVEDALFVLLLSFIKKPERFSPAPLEIPWVYSFTNDPFSDAPPVPDLSQLDWAEVDHHGEEFEVPNDSESFMINTQQLQAIAQRWDRLQSAHAKSNSAQANFHPLTKHFLVKAFHEEGIDEIIAYISCIEATLMLGEWSGRKKMQDRCSRLLDNEVECKWLKDGYKLRDQYLHGLGDAHENMSWESIAQVRWSVTKAVDKYLELTDQKKDKNREQLLKCLNSG
jgi:hypothetical protein